MTPPDELKKVAKAISEKYVTHDAFKDDCMAEIYQALRRQSVETLERPEVKDIYAYATHTYHCSWGKGFRCECGYEQARETFNKLKSDLETKGEGKT